MQVGSGKRLNRVEAQGALQLRILLHLRLPRILCEYSQLSESNFRVDIVTASWLPNGS